MRKNKNNCKLLPHIRTDLYGLSPDSMQFFSWPIKKFDIEKQWTISQGEGVIVAVIDSGCDINHEDLKDNIVDGYNFINPGKDPIDDNGHGTHVSATIAAINNGIGYNGIFQGKNVLPFLLNSNNNPMAWPIN